jgi:hypothetical protein
MTFSLYDKLRMVETRVKSRSKERENMWHKIELEEISQENNPDHEYFQEIENFRLIINSLMQERNLLMKTIEDDIIGKEA